MANVKPISLRKLPKQERSQATIEILIQATARILSEGTRPLSTNRIAEVAGVSVGSLYQYFPNKEAIVAELRRRWEQVFMDRILALARSLRGLSLREAVREFVRVLIAIHTENPQLHNALAAEVPEWERKELLHMVLAYLEGHRDEVRRENLPLAARVALQAGETLTHDTALRAPQLLEDPAFADEVTDLLARYLAN